MSLNVRWGIGHNMSMLIADNLYKNNKLSDVFLSYITKNINFHKFVYTFFEKGVIINVQ